MKKISFIISLLIIGLFLPACSQPINKTARVTNIDIVEVERLSPYSDLPAGAKIWAYPRGLVKYYVKAEGEVQDKPLFCRTYVDGESYSNDNLPGQQCAGPVYKQYRETEWQLEVGSHTIRICCSFNCGKIDDNCDSLQYYVEEDWAQ